MEIVATTVAVAVLALVIVWNVFHSRRIDALAKRVEDLEKI